MPGAAAGPGGPPELPEPRVPPRRHGGVGSGAAGAAGAGAGRTGACECRGSGGGWRPRADAAGSEPSGGDEEGFGPSGF